MSNGRGLYRTPAGERRVADWARRRLESWQVPHRTTTVATSLGETHLLRAGEGDTVCVFLPGTNFNAATSLGLLEHLARGCRVVCPDLPGQPGLSGDARPRPDADGWARWLDEVLRWVRRHDPGSRLVLAGHSRGAAVALSGPTEVDALVLLSPAGLVNVRVSPAVLRAALPWMVRPSPPRSRALLRLMCGPHAVLDEALVEWLTLVARDSHTSGAPGALPDSVVSRWRGRPVRVLSGEVDCFFPAGRIQRAASTRLGTTATTLTGLGHLAVEEDPALVGRLVTEAC